MSSILVYFFYIFAIFVDDVVDLQKMVRFADGLQASKLMEVQFEGETGFGIAVTQSFYASCHVVSSSSTILRLKWPKTYRTAA